MAKITISMKTAPKAGRRKARNRKKLCGICGRPYTNNWREHWKSQHKGHQPFELKEGEQPSSPHFVSKDGRVTSANNPGKQSEQSVKVVPEPSKIEELVSLRCSLLVEEALANYIYNVVGSSSHCF